MSEFKARRGITVADRERAERLARGEQPRAPAGRCEDCKGSGERILNPAWPSGELPYSEKCSTCSGTGRAT